MQFIKLTRKDFEKAPPAKKENPAMSFLKTLKLGEGGFITTEMAQVGRQTIKAKVKSAASDLGLKVKFHRSPADEVRFEIVG
jgi:hypothetical protein